MSKTFIHHFPIEAGSEKIVSRDISDAWSDDFRTEELTAHHISGDKYKVACVPLISRGLNRHDIVETSDNGYILSIIKPSGHSSIRVLMYDHTYYEELLRALAESNLDIEFNSHILFGIDLPTGKQRALAQHILATYGKQNIIAYEVNETPKAI